MDVIFKLIILFGVLFCCVGIVSAYHGHDVLASVRQPPSPFAGVPDLAIGVAFIVLGTLASRAINKR